MMMNWMNITGIIMKIMMIMMMRVWRSDESMARGVYDDILCRLHWYEHVLAIFHVFRCLEIIINTGIILSQIVSVFTSVSVLDLDTSSTGGTVYSGGSWTWWDPLPHQNPPLQSHSSHSRSWSMRSWSDSPGQRQVSEAPGDCGTPSPWSWAPCWGTPPRSPWSHRPATSSCPPRQWTCHPRQHRASSPPGVDSNRTQLLQWRTRNWSCSETNGEMLICSAQTHDSARRPYTPLETVLRRNGYFSILQPGE